MFRNKEDLNRLLKLLDGELTEPLEAFVIGGANLIARGLINRDTYDIDVVSPSLFSNHVISVIKGIAEREKIQPKWMNTMPSLDERFLEKGWRERSSLFFQGEFLRVMLLSRQDILGQKIAAAADRTKRDVDDILSMNPTEEEWAFGQAWARKYDGNPDWPR